MEANIEKISKDLEMIEPVGVNKFTSINIYEINYNDKKIATEKLIEAIEEIKMNDLSMK